MGAVPTYPLLAKVVAAAPVTCLSHPAGRSAGVNHRRAGSHCDVLSRLSVRAVS